MGDRSSTTKYSSNVRIHWPTGKLKLYNQLGQNDFLWPKASGPPLKSSPETCIQTDKIILVEWCEIYAHVNTHTCTCSY